jgi:hypothetical protein
MRNAILIAAVAIAVIALSIGLARHRTQKKHRTQPAAEHHAAAPAPPAPDPPMQPAAASIAGTTAAPAPPSSTELTASAREKLDTDPAAALSDIERADQLDGGHDESRRALEIRAYVRLGQVGHARALTDQFYRAFPSSAEARSLERLTGYHPRPYGP